jgi:hypothetical protein
MAASFVRMVVVLAGLLGIIVVPVVMRMRVVVGMSPFAIVRMRVIMIMIMTVIIAVVVIMRMRMVAVVRMIMIVRMGVWMIVGRFPVVIVRMRMVVVMRLFARPCHRFLAFSIWPDADAGPSESRQVLEKFVLDR